MCFPVSLSHDDLCVFILISEVQEKKKQVDEVREQMKEEITGTNLSHESPTTLHATING